MTTNTIVRAATIPLRKDHLPQALALSQVLAWPYRLEDWSFALDLGRGFAVEVDGRLAGTALWWPYGNDFASVGMVIVSPDAQRMGIGAALMDAVLADADGRSVVLNATEEGHRLYERLGFRAYGAVHQHQAVLARAPEPPVEEAPTIRPFVPADLPAIRTIDRDAAGMVRHALLDALFAIGEAVVAERDGRITGYGCVRTWGRGVVIGPVVAGDDRQALGLIATLAAPHVGAFVRVDVTLASGLSPWLELLGLPQVGRVVTMALGDIPKARGDATLFALSNQSLG